ncbi:MAG: hypothetical protein K8J08_06255 [Thermoanaerobaculia bacterium]|nr:hypothetical protein [Thermoanaerobaculia bacterium]
MQVAQAAFPYLVLDLASNTMAIRMKGRTLEVIPLQGHRLLRAGRLTATRQPLELPALWHVIKRPPSRRKVTAPATLSATENPLDPPPAAAGETPPPPDVYDFETHQGWTVEIGRELIEPTRVQLWRQALTDGWATRRGKIRSRPDRLVLEMSPESATRLHHLIRPDIPILILATAP